MQELCLGEEEKGLSEFPTKEIFDFKDEMIAK